MNNEEIRTVKLLVNNEDAAKKIDTLKTKLEQLRVGQQKALESGDPKALKEYGKEINKAERQLKKMQSQAVQVDKVLKNLDRSSVKDMEATVKRLTRELNSGHIARGGKEWDELTAAIRRTKQEIQKVKAEQEAALSLKDRLLNFGNTWMGVVTTIGGALQALSGLRSTFNSSVQAFAAMEEAEAQVVKYTGLSKQAVRELNEELKRMDTRTARERLNELAGDAGRLGIQSKEKILEFVDAADQINVALGEDLGEDAVKNIGKLTQLFGDDQRLGLRHGMLATGSAINELAQNSSASEPYILDFTGRLAGAAHQANITQANVMGLAATLDQNMVSAEKGATALQKVIIKLYQDPAKVARLAGLDVQEFTRLLKEDANAALLQFLQSLSSMGSLDQLAPFFGDMQMSGAAIVQVLSTLAGNIDNVRAQQQLASQAFADATSITKEFNVQNNTVQAGLDKAKKRFNDLAVELGEKLSPVMRYTMSTSSLMLRGMILLVDFLKVYGIEVAAIGLMWTVYALRVKIATAATTAYHAVVSFGRNVILGYRAAMVLARDAVVGCSLANQRMYRLMLSQNVVTKAATAVTLLFRAAMYALKFDIAAATASLKAFRAVMATTGWVYLAVAAIAVATAAIVRYAKKVNELTAAEKARREASRRATEEYERQTSNVQRLIKAINDESISQKQRIEYMKQLEEATGIANLALDKQNRLTEESKKKLDEWLETMMKTIAIDAYKEDLGELYSKRRTAEKAIKEEEKKQASHRAFGASASSVNTGPGSGGASLGWFFVDRIDQGKVDKLKKEKSDADAAIDALEEDIKTMERELIVAGKSLTNTGGGGGGGGDEDDDKTSKGDPHALTRKQMENEAMQQRMELQSQYSLRLIDYREYTERMAQLDVDLCTRQRDLYAQNSEHWLELNKKVLDAQ